MKKLVYFALVPLLYGNEWELKNIFLETENDADARTDRDYTYGSEIGALFKIEKKKYISFSIAHQMYTPKDFDKDDVDFTKERPYAGYMYLNGGLHFINNNHLDSFNMQLGIVGPAAQMDEVQKIIHDIIGSPEPKGWDEQIENEVIVQINYERRWFQDLKDLNGNIVYFAGANLGNASIKAGGGFFFRTGWNIERDFAPSRIHYRGYNNIPLEGYSHKKLKQSFSFSLYADANVIGRDIFLDGNTFKDSISVDKEYFVAKGGFGFNYRYQDLTINYMHTFSTKEFKTQSYYHSYGSLIFSYNY